MTKRKRPTRIHIALSDDERAMLEEIADATGEDRAAVFRRIMREEYRLLTKEGVLPKKSRSRR